MEIIQVNTSADNITVSGRELHRVLGVKTAYKDWFPRMCEYGFERNCDYTEVPLKNEQNPLGGRARLSVEPMRQQLIRRI